MHKQDISKNMTGTASAVVGAGVIGASARDAAMQKAHG